MISFFKHRITYFMAVIPFVLSTMISCSENDDRPDTKFENLTGYVQKGPFLTGSTIQIAELDKDLNPTGKVYTTQTRDNTGFFEIESLELSSGFVELKADGYYFNEVSGDNSSAPITLYALTKLSDSIRCNVNVLTHLERNRIKYLVREGLSFSEAKQLAQQEIFSFFTSEGSSEINSEYLDITKGGLDHAQLLGISILMQASRSESQFSELLATFSIDLEQDGMVESDIKSEIVNKALGLNYSAIRNNLEQRYGELMSDYDVAAFENFIDQFINVSDNPIASFEFSVNALEVSFINYSQNTSTYVWDFGDGSSSTEANPTHTYDEPGLYTVTLTASNQSTSASYTKQVSLTIDYLQLLVGDDHKTWYLLRDGIAIGLGPDVENNEWWSFGVVGYTPSAERRCILDDSFTFFRNGDWVHDTHGTLFVDALDQGGWKETADCHDETEPGIWTGLNGEDLSAFANGGNYTFTFNQEINSITLHGLGVYIGMPVISSTGLNYTPEEEKQYAVTRLEAGETADLLSLSLYDESVPSYWNFYFISYHDINDLPPIPME